MFILQVGSFRERHLRFNKEDGQNRARLPKWGKTARTGQDRQNGAGPPIGADTAKKFEEPGRQKLSFFYFISIFLLPTKTLNFCTVTNVVK